MTSCAAAFSAATARWHCTRKGPVPSVHLSVLSDRALSRRQIFATAGSVVNLLVLLLVLELLVLVLVLVLVFSNHCTTPSIRIAGTCTSTCTSIVKPLALGLKCRSLARRRGLLWGYHA